jgi:hypothetical protein
MLGAQANRARSPSGERRSGGDSGDGQSCKERSEHVWQEEGPYQEFVHSEGCRILAADPHVEIPWNEVEAGHWRAEWVCTIEYCNEPFADDRVRLDPLDPKTSRHAGECEYRDTTDPAVIKLILNIKPGMSEGYEWVTCNACETSWQVPYFAEESVG